VVESAMSSGLDAIKSVGALLSAEQQLNSCLNRIKEAKKYIFDFDKGDKDREAKVENEGKKEVRTILVQMILSAFRGNSATVGIAAERAVNAVFIASELYGIASGVVQQAGEDRKSEAKKSVARKEEEREMCHEDRELLKGRPSVRLPCISVRLSAVFVRLCVCLSCSAFSICPSASCRWSGTLCHRLLTWLDLSIIPIIQCDTY
jgi:hypothetical protein